MTIRADGADNGSIVQTAKAATMVQVYNYFKTPDYPLAKFRVEWAMLSDEHKAAIREGIGNGSLTY